MQKITNTKNYMNKTTSYITVNFYLVISNYYKYIQKLKIADIPINTNHTFISKTFFFYLN